MRRSEATVEGARVEALKLEWRSADIPEMVASPTAPPRFPPMEIEKVVSNTAT